MQSQMTNWGAPPLGAGTERSAEGCREAAVPRGQMLRASGSLVDIAWLARGNSRRRGGSRVSEWF